jgi:hypothetical protein
MTDSIFFMELVLGGGHHAVGDFSLAGSRERKEPRRGVGAVSTRPWNRVNAVALIPRCSLTRKLSVFGT